MEKQIEFKVIHNETRQDHSDECYLNKDGEYVFINVVGNELIVEKVDTEQYNIITTTLHYPF